MTWRFAPDLAPSEPALASARVRAALCSHDVATVFAALLEVHRSDPEGRHGALVDAAKVARGNPALLRVDRKLMRAAARGSRSGAAALAARVQKWSAAQAPEVEPQEAAVEPAPVPRRVVKVPKGVRSVRKARRRLRPARTGPVPAAPVEEQPAEEQPVQDEAVAAEDTPDATPTTDDPVA